MRFLRFKQLSEFFVFYLLALLVLGIGIAVSVVGFQQQETRSKPAPGASQQQQTGSKAAPGTSSCTKVASPNGSDSASGRKSAPFETAQKLIDSLQPGETGCLRAGTYIGVPTRGHGTAVSMRRGGTSETQRVILQNYPGEHVTIRTHFSIEDGAAYITLQSAPGERWMLKVDGSGGGQSSKPTNQGRVNNDQALDVDGDHIIIRNIEVTSRNDQLASNKLYKTGTCLSTGNHGPGISADYNLFEGNKIHNCGVRYNQKDRSHRPNFWPNGAALDNRDSDSPDNHGMYLNTTSTGTIIRNNLFYDNGEQGIKIGPMPKNAIIENNVFDGNGNNMTFGGSATNNIVRNNIITFPVYTNNARVATRNEVLTGSGNQFIGNCAWDNNPQGANLSLGRGVIESRTIAKDPMYRDRQAHDYTLSPSSPCLGKGPDFIQPDASEAYPTTGENQP